MNEELRNALLERGFVNTNGCYFHKSSGMYLLRVWVHNHGGQAEVKSNISRDEYNRVARLPEFDVIAEVDSFFKPYELEYHCTCNANNQFLGHIYLCDYCQEKESQ